ncbi:MAG: hypothetical protein O7G31_16350, partial [Calditrichaeota bacterium]|nr:hypothetical protein [Calditrichota bacterium]
MSKNRNRNLPSILLPWHKKLLMVALTLAISMLANTVYLLANRLADALNLRFFAAGETTLPELFQAMILTHTGLGLIVVTVFLIFAVSHLPKVWRRRHQSSIESGSLYVATGLILLVTGLFILTESASQDNRWAWWTHVICAGLAALGYAVHRLVSYSKPVKGSFAKDAIAVISVIVILLVAHGFTNHGIVRTQEAQLALGKELHNGPGAKSRVVSEFLDSKFVPLGFVPTASPFFPSAATTTT